MTLELTDWDKDLPSQGDEEYQALIRTLNFTEGFGLLFVRCSPAKGKQLITKVQEDISNKNIEVLRLDKAVNNLYEIIDNLDNKKEINILFITGLEYSFYQYEECKSLMGWNSIDRYSYSWKGVPPVLINLNQQRERFRDNFNICFVFLLPIFAIKYFIQRAPDFFDWRSGLFEFPIDAETLKQESSRIIQDGDYEKYRNLTPKERTQAILAIQELIAEDNQTPARKCDLLITLRNLQSAGQNYKEAIADFENALVIQPDEQSAWLFRGIALLNLGRNEEAIADFDKALAIQANDQIACFFRGIALLNLGRNEEAVTSSDKALAIQPDYQDAWYLRGYALLNLGRNEEAIADFDKALAIQANDHEVWYLRGYVLGKLGHNEKAIADFDKALAIQPDKHQAWNNRGIALGELGRNEEAIADFDKALAIQPDKYQAWYNRGIALENLGDNEQAVASYDKALAIQPDQYQAWNNRGIALRKLGRNEEAIASYDKALAIQPDDYQAWNNRGIAFLKLGRNEEAIADFDKALAIQPDYQNARNNRRVASIKLKWQKLTKTLTGFLRLIGFIR
ncbi:tetratricopeptide TPR_2 [Calothrix brevissima NIES-22]|nr:tetratricopeptide TPR_2 [Calothrix brevissima NIES-22]